MKTTDLSSLCVIAIFIAVLGIIMGIAHIILDVQEHAEQWAKIDQCTADIGVLAIEHKRWGISEHKDGYGN